MCFGWNKTKQGSHVSCPHVVPINISFNHLHLHTYIYVFICSRPKNKYAVYVRCIHLFLLSRIETLQQQSNSNLLTAVTIHNFNIGMDGFFWKKIRRKLYLFSLCPFFKEEQRKMHDTVFSFFSRFVGTVVVAARASRV